MRPVTLTVSDASGGAKSSNPILLDYFCLPAVSLQVVVTGTVDYTVEQTLDDPAVSGATWFSHPDTNLVSQTVNRQGNYAYTPRATRITLNSGTGSVAFTVLQAGTLN